VVEGVTMRRVADRSDRQGRASTILTVSSAYWQNTQRIIDINLVKVQWSNSQFRTIFLVIKLKTKSVRTLLDTGSVTFIISESFPKQHRLTVCPLENDEYSLLILATGKPLDV